MSTTEARQALLKAKGLRATPQRLALLACLTKAKGPASIAELQALEEGEGMDTATFYRGVESLVSAGLVRKVNLNHGHTDYELSTEGDHHHHLVCTNCSTIEDFDWCPEPDLEKKILKKSARFAQVDEHALELFGLCKRCA